MITAIPTATLLNVFVCSSVVWFISSFFITTPLSFPLAFASRILEIFSLYCAAVGVSALEAI